MRSHDRKRRKKTKKKKHGSNHHIKPRSRGGNKGNQFGDNISVICGRCHEHYHNAHGLDFGNMNPDEIIAFIVHYYWKDQWGWVSEAIKHKDEYVFD